MVCMVRHPFKGAATEGQYQELRDSLSAPFLMPLYQGLLLSYFLKLPFKDNIEEFIM